MRAVVQRVKSASVEVSGEILGRIEKGYLVLIGIKKGDGKKEARYLAKKLSNLGVMADEKGRMSMSLIDTGGKMLLVSQFTLCADTNKGNRPSFIQAEKPDRAEELYNFLIEELRGYKTKIETGKFGAFMKIEAQLDGPVTIFLEK